MTVHNHPPYRPVCNERSVDGQLRGACLNDDGSTAMSADPTAEHIDAVARAISCPYEPGGFDRGTARMVLTSTDPAVHAALAASLPAEVKIASLTDAEMLAALVDRGNDAELARRLEWATGLIGATLLVAIRSEGLEVVRVKPEQVAP